MSKPVFVVVPQWQGSSSSRAMRLVDGADAIRGDLPQAATRVVSVPAEAGDRQETGVARFSSIHAVREAQRQVYADLDDDEVAITIGGDCGVELGAVGRAMRHSATDADPTATGTTALVWLDAHADLNTPESSPSGTFHGMVLRAIMGDTVAALVPQPTEIVPPEHVILAGVRACDPDEDAYIDERGLRCLSVDELADPETVVTAIEKTGATSVYLHIDLDVLDPADVQGVAFPEPFGLAPSNLIALIHAIRERFPLAGAGLTEFAPASAEAAADDLPTILRLIGALTKKHT